MRSKIACNRPRQRADTRLQKDVRRGFVPLLRRLLREGRIPLHDPERNLRIALECRVLHEHPALFLRQICCVAHGVIIVVRRKGRLRAESADVCKALCRAALRHKDMGKEPEQLRRPRDTAPMVPVCRRHERDAAQLLAVLRPFHVLIAQRPLGQSQNLCEICRDRIARAKTLKRIQTEPLALVLHHDSAEPQIRRETFQIGQRGRLICGQAPVKSHRVRRSLCPERRDICARSLGMQVLYCLDGFVHDVSPPDRFLFHDIFSIIPQATFLFGKNQKIHVRIFYSIF